MSRFIDRPILADGLGEDLVGVLVYTNGVELEFQLAVNVSIIAMRVTFVRAANAAYQGPSSDGGA